MAEYNANIEIESGSEKSFGVVFAIFFLLIGLYPLVDNKEVLLWSLITSLILFLVTYVAPKVLSVPNRLWFKFRLALGAIVAPVVMALVYFTTVVPIGLLMRLIGKDMLLLKIDKNAKSYWIQRDQPMRSIRDQF